MAKKKKIYIGGSMTFAREMKEAQKILADLGYEVFVPLDTEHVIADPKNKYNTSLAKELNVGRGDADLVVKSDALLVLNYDKRGIKGYIGPASYRDMSVAWYFKKKIFLLQMYDENQNNHKYEMLGFKPVILEGSLEKIKKHL